MHGLSTVRVHRRVCTGVCARTVAQQLDGLNDSFLCLAYSSQDRICSVIYRLTLISFRTQTGSRSGRDDLSSGLYLWTSQCLA